MGIDISALQSYLAYKAVQHNQLIKKNNPKSLPKQIPEIIYRLPEVSEINKLDQEKIKIPLDTNILYENFQITEYEYLEFLKWVTDSIVFSELMHYGNIMNMQGLKSYLKRNKKNELIEYGDILPYSKINWIKRIQFDEIKIKQILNTIQFIDNEENLIIADYISFKYQDILWDKIFNELNNSKRKPKYYSITSCFSNTSINIFPKNELGRFFKENYYKKSFNKTNLDKYKTIIIKGISYEQAYAYYIWRNSNKEIPKNANPLNYYTIPTKEQWQKVSYNEPLHLPTELILSKSSNDLDESSVVEEFPFRIIMDVFYKNE